MTSRMIVTPCKEAKNIFHKNNTSASASASASTTINKEISTSLASERGKSYMRSDGTFVCVNSDDTRTITHPDGSVSTQMTYNTS